MGQIAKDSRRSTHLADKAISHWTRNRPAREAAVEKRTEPLGVAKVNRLSDVLEIMFLVLCHMKWNEQNNIWGDDFDDLSPLTDDEDDDADAIMQEDIGGLRPDYGM